MASPNSQQTSSSSSTFSPPSSILIIGSGVYGLTTAWALTKREAFKQCRITVVDRSDPVQLDVFPAPDAASVDTSRIVRADYADPAYAALCAEAQLLWRQQADPSDLGAQGRYNESGMVLVADGPAPATAGDVSATLPAPPSTATLDKSKLTGMDYARYSWANVQALAASDPKLSEHIRELPDAAAIREAVGTGGTSGSWGYLNKLSGWTDAGKTMKWLYDQVQETTRVIFTAGTVTSLEHTGDTVTGARLSDGSVLTADLVIVAAGSWTESLVDLEGQGVATGQVLGYLDITEEEQEKLGKMPVLLNLSSGLFIIPPSNRVLKIARHAYGYLNPTPLTATSALPPSPSSKPVERSISQPLTHLADSSLSIPPEGEEDLRRALQEMIPLPELRDRPFTKTRLCWYLDTPTADFIIDYHPGWKGLFVATGDSGHAFKFMPVLGEKIVDCVSGNCPVEFKDKWSWKPRFNGGEPVITEDGSRGGKPGLVLADELAKRTAT